MEKNLETEPGPLDCLCDHTVHASSNSVVQETLIKEEFCRNCYVIYDPKLDKCKCNEGIGEKNKKSKKVDMLEYYTETTPIRRNTKEDAALFLEKRKLKDFFNFLICHLLVKRPEDPIEFLTSLLDDCMYFRACIKTAPLLYEDKHLQAIVASFDPINQSHLTYEQYKNAFATLGLTDYHKNPPRISEDQICGSFFISEANGLLKEQLARMVKVHKDEINDFCKC